MSHIESLFLTWVRSSCLMSQRDGFCYTGIHVSVCPHACHQEIIFWNVRIFVSIYDENSFRVYMLQLDINGLFLICLFILALMQLNYDTVRNRMVLALNWFLNWGDHGSWHFKFLNFKIHWILWILRGLRLCARKDQNHAHCHFSASANSWNRRGKQGRLTSPGPLENHIWVWTEECWSNELSDHRDLSDMLVLLHRFCGVLVFFCFWLVSCGLGFF